MEYPKLEDPLADNSTLSHEFIKLSPTQSYTILNRDSELSDSIIPVDLIENVLYRFRLYRDFTLRESSDTTITRTDKMLIEEGYIVYNTSTHSISFSNIHRVDGSRFTYQVKYLHKMIHDETLFVPQLIMYSGDDGIEITMKLDENANILQVYNDTVPMVVGEFMTLGSCPLPNQSPSDSDGVQVVGSKNIDVMTALSYILSNEVSELKLIGDLMVREGIISRYIIS